MNYPRIKEMAEAYAGITGRPLATLTVDEFMKFAMAVSKENTNDNVFLNTSDNMPITKNTDILAAMTPTTNSSDIKKYHTKQNKSETKNDKDTMLQMLRSVNG